MDKVQGEYTTSTVPYKSYRHVTRSSTRLRIKQSQASPLTAGNCIRGLNPCPLQSHSRAHPRFGQPTLPDWERLSRNSSNTHTGHTPLSISRGPGWSPQPISPSYNYFCFAAPEDEAEIGIHKSPRPVYVRIPPAWHSGVLLVGVTGQTATIDAERVRVSVPLCSSSLDRKPMAIIEYY